MSICKHGSNKEQLLSLLKHGCGRIHMVGVLGVSMSALAEALSDMGFTVSGSDRAADSIGMRKKGIIMPDDPTDYILGADALIYSLAVPRDDVHRALARIMGVPEYSRAELLGALMMLYRHRIGISGTHGKSTTTAILAKIFSTASLLPTVLSGADLSGAGAYLHGEGEYLVYEACEYKRAFLHFAPSCAIITNIELDHTDCYASYEELCSAFISSVESAERVILPYDLAELIQDSDKEVLTFGISPKADLCYVATGSDKENEFFRLIYRGEDIGEYSIATPGIHNVKNAAAAALAALSYGVCPDVIRSALSGFCGISRRMELLGSIGDVAVYYDYAHHPREIEAVISTLRGRYGRVSVAFRPHTYTRTRDLWRGFVDALSLADRVYIYEIFAAREQPIEGVSSRRLAESIKGAVSLAIGEIPEELLERSRGAIVIMGAGELDFLLAKVKEIIRKRG